MGASDSKTKKTPKDSAPLIALIFGLLIGVAGVMWFNSRSNDDSQTVGAISSDQNTSISVAIRGGHDTLPVDMGRPVILIANALKVSPQAFRDAFSRVRPSPAGVEPDGTRVRQNKDVLLTALGPMGVTNERLDEVSDYYRYRPGGNELWRHEPAEVEAIVKNGELTGFDIKDAGAGYSSAPRIEVPGFPNAQIEVKLNYGTDLATNGSIREVRLVDDNQDRPQLQ